MIVQRAGFTLDQWEKLLRDPEVSNLRPAVLQRRLKISYEDACSLLGRAHRLKLLDRRSEYQYSPTALLCSVCQERLEAPAAVSVASFTTAAPDRPPREPVPPQLRFRVLQRDNFRCRYCGRTAGPGVQLHLDHVIPVSNGGETKEGNLVTACSICNLGKSDRAVLPD
jgi:hypothetical protein